MTKGFVICAMACGVALPADAGERNAAASVALKIPAPRPILSVRKPASAPGTRARRLPVAPLSNFVVRLHAVPEPGTTLAAFESRSGGRIELTASTNAAIGDVREAAAWRISDRLPATTSSANGLYAVRDTLAELPRRRAFRSTPFSTTLVLRIDGNDSSPAFSIGGGGVAAALWRAMPQ